MCGGHEEFARSGGRTLPLRLARSVAATPIAPGMRVLDVGAGRGEVARYAAAQGAEAWALDYSPHSLQMVRLIPGVHPLFARATGIPGPAESFDVVFLLDIVEHLTPDELSLSLSEARRVLRPRGTLVVHTMPNTWYYRFGYPLYAAFMTMRGMRLPVDPRDRCPAAHEMHINEQNPVRLGQALRKAGFRSRIFLATTDDYAREKSGFVRTAMNLLVRVPLLKLVLCNDIFAVARKR